MEVCEEPDRFFGLIQLKDNGKVKFVGITGYPLENFRSVYFFALHYFFLSDAEIN